MRHQERDTVMDYDYDHLTDGVEQSLSTLSPLLRALETKHHEADETPAWLTAALDVEEELIHFPEVDRPHIDRARCAVALIGKLGNLDGQVLPPYLAQLLADRLGCELDTQSWAMDRHYGITVPFEVRYPPAVQVEPLPFSLSP